MKTINKNIQSEVLSDKNHNVNLSDEDLRDFFQKNKPQLNDDATYLAGLSAKMDAVAEVQKIRKETLRSYRISALIAFVAGVAIGIGILGFIFLNPSVLQNLASLSEPSALIDGSFLPSILSSLANWQYFLWIGFALIVITLSLIPLTKSPRF